MKVVATKVAFFNGARVRVGAEMDIPDGTKGSWFVAVDSPAAKAAQAKPAKAEPKALSEVAKRGKSFVETHAGEAGDPIA